MAATALDIVSLDAIKTELRLGGDTEDERTAYEDHDDLLTAQIEAAVSFVSRHITASLIDRTKTVWCPPALDTNPLYLQQRYVKTLDSVAYWTPAGALREDPDGVIEIAGLGRHEYGTNDNLYTIYPPTDGWPDALENSLYKIQLTRGLDLTDASPALKQAIILCVRQFYDGYREIRPTEAFYALIAPWRRYD